MGFEMDPGDSLISPSRSWQGVREVESDEVNRGCESCRWWVGG